MNLQNCANIATIAGFVLFTIMVLIDRWYQMIKWGRPYLPKIALAALISAVISAGVSLYAVWYIKPPIPEVSAVSHEYYLVSKDGTILKNNGLDQYGINIKKANIAMMKGSNNENVPTYILLFKKTPAYVDVANQEGAVTNVKQINPNEYRVQFYSTGWLDGAVECDFKIQLY